MPRRRPALPTRRHAGLVAGLGALVLAALLAGPVSPAVATDGARGVTVPVGAETRGEALAAFQAVRDAARVDAGWTGSSDSCTVGTESAESRAATLTAINTMRSLVGAAPVTFDDGLNRKALAAALMMRAQGALSHSPGQDWRCWTADGAEGAGSSNLFLGASGARAVEGYVDDGGIDSLGHRRWVLNPEARTFGTGSTGSTNALWIFGPGAVAAPAGTAVVWPPAGHVAEPWVFQQWSLEILRSSVTGLDGAAVAVAIDGAPTSVTSVRQVDRAFGPGSTLSWRVPAVDSLTAGDHDVTVTVTGVGVDGDTAPITWRTTIVDPDLTPVDEPPVFAGRPVVKPAAGSTGVVRPGTRLAVRWDVQGADRTTVAWLRDGRPMTGATGRSYVVRRADRGHGLRALVTATGAGGTSTSRSVVLRIP